jgi:hypothetical protein
MLDWKANNINLLVTRTQSLHKNGKAIPVTGREGP